MLSFRNPTLTDAKLYFEWANDSLVREQSYNSSQIDFENHKKWFTSKLGDASCIMLIFQNEEKSDIGQIRIQKENDQEALIGISIAKEHRGNGYANEMLQLATDYFLKSNLNFFINAYIKESNVSSKYAFEKAGFEFKELIDYESFKSFHYIKRAKI